MSIDSPVAPGLTNPPARGVIEAIGNTPLVALDRYLGRSDLSLWAKLEASNPGGSTKARSASRMIGDAIDAGLIGPETTVIESTSGNLGVGLAQVCGYHRVPLICVVDSRAHQVNLGAMTALGADVRVVTEPDPDTGDLLTARLKLVADLLERTPDAYCPDQYSNESNPAAHAEGTMREIDEALDGELDYLFVATSTTGTLLGCADYLLGKGRSTRIVAVDATGSVLFGGRRGERRLPGLGAGIATPLSRRASFDRLLRVSDVDCVIGARRLAQREAILAGASSGGVLAAVDRLAPELDPRTRCAVILADGGSGYLSTVFDDGWVEDELGLDPHRLAEMVAGDSPPRP